MKNIIKRVIKKIRYFRLYLHSKETSEYVKSYYKKNKNKNIPYLKNIWNKNIYWDFFIQSLPHGIKSKYYVPYDYYTYKIEPCLNDAKTSNLTALKNLYDKLFSDSLVKQPKTLLRCMNYIYMDRDYNTVNKPIEVISKLKQDIIIKPGTNTHGGTGILKYTYDNGQYCKINHKVDFNIEEICREMKGDFIIQEVVQQHPELAQFHKHSVNTIRVVSYRSVKTNKIIFPMSLIKFGVNDSYVDNISAGGVCVGIHEDGSLMKFAFDYFGNHFNAHPNTELKFEGYKIPSYEKIKEAIIKLSNVVPYQRLIGWDFSVDPSGKPVMIELNVGQGSWMIQIANGRPLFGEYSDEIKDYIDNLKK